MHRMDTNWGRIVGSGAFPAEEGRAWAAIPTARANGPGFGALGRAEARQPPPAERPPEASGVAAALAHNGARFLTPPPSPKARTTGPPRRRPDFPGPGGQGCQ